ncbi:M10 family metallopeptidase [Microvirga pudoricolor]|uniref:M10 family metallopeptidase n=1 Tax=Microvirga pudoricolor TaxID=2778729 RepID=UPI00194DBF6A|nr:M10 family metallopeptidase [Microvirga pudoricolor]MBM6595414.1 M10 family metallopeptidase [Microvirga pudoricolor]
MVQKFIRALRNEREETAEIRRYQNLADGEGAVISYSFMSAAPEGVSGFSTYMAAEQAQVHKVLAQFQAVANVTFVEASDTAAANLLFGQRYMPGWQSGEASTPLIRKSDGSRSQVEVWLDTEYDLAKGDVRIVGTALHEIGHALGLKHSGEGAVRLPSAEDARANTTMSYNGDMQLRLGIFDIAALEAIYGPAQTKLGANTYTFGKDKVIVDGGGTDTLTAASSKTKVVIDLNGGAWSYANKKAGSLVKDGQVYIGEHTVIERATGSKHNDTVRGNAADNLLKGGAGNDTVDGRTGNDRLYGDGGNDKLYGGLGDDALYGGAGKDTSLSEMGTLESHDWIRDFSAKQGDRIDLRKVDFDPAAGGRQKMTFLGNGTDDARLSASKAGQAYYNTAGDELRVDADGDGIADYALGIKGVASMKASYFLL